MAGLENQYKEWFSRAFLQAVTAKAGVAVEFISNDVWGVDAALIQAGDSVDIQLKATSSLLRDSAGRPQFDLDVATYDKLRATSRHAYAYLVLVEVPELRVDWVAHEPGRLLLAREAYFFRLTGLPSTGNASRVRLTFPLENLLTADSIERIMLHSRTGRRELKA